MLGLGDEHLSHTVAEFVCLIHEDDRQMVLGRVQRCLDSEGPYFSEHRMLRADGCTVWVEDRGDTVERSADGTPLRMLGSMIDITARRQAEDALRIKDAAIESSLNGVALADLAGRVTYVNPAFCRLWGVSADEVIGRTVSEFWATAGDMVALAGELMTAGQCGSAAGREPPGRAAVSR